MASNSTRQSLLSIVSAVADIARTGWKWILLGAILGTAFAIAALSVLTPTWEAKAVAGPVVPDMRYGLSQGVSLTGGLSFLGQASGPEGQRFERFLVLLRSYAFAERIENHHHVMRLIFYKRWDAQNNRWLPSHSLGGYLRQFVGLPYSDEPTIDDLQKYLTSNIGVSLAAPQTPNRNITFAFKDRELAVNILRWSLEEADQMIRETTERNVDVQIGYLENKLRNDTVSSVQNRAALTDVLTSAERSKILLVGGQPYAAEIIEPPRAPQLPTWPDPKSFVLFGLLIGAAAGSGFAWLNFNYHLLQRARIRFRPVSKSGALGGAAQERQ